MFFLSGLILLACKKDADENSDSNLPDNNNNNNTEETVEYNKYLASGSYGDVIRYEIDEENNIYKYYNETTGQSDSGTYVVSNDANLQGVYEVSLGSDNFYAVELADKAFATSLPSGRAENELCFGLSADLDLSTSFSTSDIAGKYLFIIYDDLTSSEIWGGYELFSDGTYTWQLGPQDEANFDENTHFAGGGSGTWGISSEDPSRLIFTEDGIDYFGTVYPGKAMLIDNGTGNGFTLGIYYPDTHVSQSDVAGYYRYLDITLDGDQGVGYYNIPSSGSELSYYYKYRSSSEGTGSCSDFTTVGTVNNMFKCTDIFDGDTFYNYFIILPGEVMLHFCAGDNGLVSYGIGAKIN